MIRDAAGLPPPIPAATVIVVRDADDGLEVLMLRRNAKLVFGGMWVFPGGRIDPGDGEGEDGARRGAAREALEEAALVLDPADLVPFAHWTPPGEAPKRFATWFFLVGAPDVHEVEIDGGEIHEHEWISPARMLERHAAGEVELAPPTWVSLHRLASAGSVAAAIAAAEAAPLRRYLTRVGRTADGGLVTMWEGDAGYESGDAEAPGPRHRILMSREGGWTYEHS